MPFRVRHVTIDDHIKMSDKFADSHFRQYLPHNVVHIFEYRLYGRFFLCDIINYFT
jgi:hypothetical protein